MGHLDVIPLLAKGINIYLPILITLLCLATWLRYVLSRLTLQFASTQVDISSLILF
jgi:uncharacterized oligopeptide transporter (OPT) family protein